MLNNPKTKIAVKPDFMTHLKTLNTIYSKAVFCDLVAFRSKPAFLNLG